MTGRERGDLEVSGEMAEGMTAPVEHFEAPLLARSGGRPAA